MADTTNLGITKPTVGADTDTWGGIVNTGLDDIDAVFAAAGSGTSVGLNVGAGKVLTVGGSISNSAGTANGVAYLNGSKVLTSGSALTFDGTNLGVGASSPSTTIDINGGTKNQVAIFRSTDAIATIGFADNTTPLTGNLSYVTIGAEGNSMVFNTNLNERMKIDSAGNLGLGVTPSASSTLVKALDLNTTGGIGSYSNSTSSQFTYVSSNAYLNSGVNWTYKLTGYPATMYLQNNGASSGHSWNTAPSGTAGAAISFTQAMTLTAAGNLGIGTSSPVRALHIDTASNHIQLSNSTTGGATSDGFTIGLNGSLAQIIQREAADIAIYTTGTERLRLDSAGDVLLLGGTLRIKDSGNTAQRGAIYGDASSLHINAGVNNLIAYTAGAQRLTLDSAGNLGLGVTPATTTGYTTLQLFSATGTYLSSQGYNTNLSTNAFRGSGAWTKGGSSFAATIYQQTYLGEHIWSSAAAGSGTFTPAEAMRITSAGSVGIGVSSPTAKLSVYGGAIGDVPLAITHAWGSSSTPLITASNGSGEVMRLERSGNLLVGTTTANAKLHVVGESTVDTEQKYAFFAGGPSSQPGLYIGGNNTSGSTVAVGNRYSFIRSEAPNGGGRSLYFQTGSDTRMILTHDGDLLVGKPAVDNGSTVGIEIRGSDSKLYVTDLNSSPFALNRLGSDGNIAVFQKNGATVGVIGTENNHLIIGKGDTGLKFQDGVDSIFPWNTDTNSGRDNAIDLGYSTTRFDDIYATNGTINTSDRNEKQDIETLSEAETRVAVACKGLLRKFRWIDSVAEKGDEARIHFGIIAQDLQDAFAAEGLDAGRYAMFISSTWTDEETGGERTRMGVRYSELLAFIIAAI